MLGPGPGAGGDKDDEEEQDGRPGNLQTRDLRGLGGCWQDELRWREAMRDGVLAQRRETETGKVGAAWVGAWEGGCHQGVLTGGAIAPNDTVSPLKAVGTDYSGQSTQLNQRVLDSRPSAATSCL